jgi:hypothetical protein
VESPGYDEINFPGSHFHVILPLSKIEEESDGNQKVSATLNFEIMEKAVEAK